jgi:membrane protein YqaA with SNARE-associated domain
LSQHLYTWLSAYGPAGLFFIAFFHDIFSPVPPEVLFLPLALQHPERAWWLGIVTTLGSVAGGLVGYLIGWFLGRPILNKWLKPAQVERAERLFHTHGARVLFVATFTPVPFKLVTIPAGALRIPFTRFLIASLGARGLRFMAQAAIIYWFGPKLVEQVFNNIGLVSASIGLVSLAVWLLWRRYWK